MPDEISHISLALNNQKTIEYLFKDYKDYSDWIANIAFYKALHIVEAVFYNNKKIKHGHNHEDREYYLKTNNKYKHIFKQYRVLWATSIVARYLEDSQSNYDAVSSFSQVYSPDDVIEKILKHRLFQLEKSAKIFISKKCRKILDTQKINY